MATSRKYNVYGVPLTLNISSSLWGHDTTAKIQNTTPSIVRRLLVHDGDPIKDGWGFLGLLDFVSRATVMAQASVRPSSVRP